MEQWIMDARHATMRASHTNDDAPLGAFEEQVMLAVVHARAEAFGMNVRRELERRHAPCETAAGAAST